MLLVLNNQIRQLTVNFNINVIIDSGWSLRGMMNNNNKKSYFKDLNK